MRNQTLDPAICGSSFKDVVMLRCHSLREVQLHDGDGQRRSAGADEGIIAGNRSEKQGTGFTYKSRADASQCLF